MRLVIHERILYNLHDLHGCPKWAMQRYLFFFCVSFLRSASAETKHKKEVSLIGAYASPTRALQRKSPLGHRDPARRPKFLSGALAATGSRIFVDRLLR